MKTCVQFECDAAHVNTFFESFGHDDNWEAPLELLNLNIGDLITFAKNARSAFRVRYKHANWGTDRVVWKINVEPCSHPSWGWNHSTERPAG